MAAIIERLYGTERIMRKKHVGDEVLPTTKEAISNLARISWPSVVETVLISLISLVSTWMVSGLGTEAVAAVGLSSQPRFLCLAIFMSLNTGITAVISRRRGQGDAESANRTLRQVLLLSSCMAIFISVIGIIFARDLLIWIGAQEDAIDMATTYTRVVVGGLLFNALSININAAQRGCGNTKVSMVSNITGNLCNILVGFLFIEGRFGLPALGVLGAALAAATSFVVSFLISLRSVMSSSNIFLNLSFKESFKPDRETLSPVLTIAGSAAVEQVFMRIGFLVFAKIIANLGTMAYATHQICLNLQNIAFAFGEGLCVAAASLVGQSLGRKEYGSAQLYGQLAQRVGLTLGVVLATFFFVMQRALIVPFSEDANVIALGAKLLIILACLVPGQISQVIFSTILRVSGDTRYVALVSFCSITIVRTLSAYVLCYPLGLGLVGAWLGLFIDQYLRLILNGLRFAKGKWVQIKL